MSYVTAVNSAGESDFSSTGGNTTKKTQWGGGSLTVTGFYSGTASFGYVYALTTNPSTYTDFEAVKTDWAGYGMISNSTNTCNWDGGDRAPSDGTYTIVVEYSTSAYKFTNVTITGGSGTVPFNEVVGSVVGTNGRLK
jgi:hypothetical protein